MKLTYWRAERLDDAECYDVRAKTRREVVQRVRETIEAFGEHAPPRYGLPEKVTLEYRDGFDLLDGCLSEGGWRTLRTDAGRG